MIYDMSDQALSEGVLPTMHWRLDTSEFPIVDGNKTVDCESESLFTVERDIELAFYNSNQRWMLFFSRSVQVRCEDIPGRPTILQVVEGEANYDDPYLIIRGALIVSSSNTSDDDRDFQERYASQLRASADVYPGQSTSVTHSFNQQIDVARISFDWDAQSMGSSSRYVDDQMVSRNANEMIIFALPHHREILAGKVSSTLCTTSILGPVCLVEGNVWNMFENLPVVDFQAARHPDPQYVPILAQALLDDIRYQIPSNFQSGAADTYFSGKTIAKLARILLVAEEVALLCASAQLGVIGESNDAYLEACDDLELPSDTEFEEALNQLRDSVTVWVRTNPKTPFVYDNAWGGLVNCGCLYDNGECTNVFPNCPAFTDQGLNFGNGFYNDHHFHYGYHVYAAAALAHFDSDWAVEYYEDVALLVRDYANPSQEDTAFPVFRNKDWYRGHSWASGFTNPMFRDVMNQESSSEAIMAYEAVALFGKTMASIFQDTGDADKASVAKMMHKIGLTLTATEIRSTQKYWQVRQNVEDSEKIYPGAYTASVVGILWETFAQFTTWFGNAPYLIYGIQLLPLTPISEARDGLEWANEIYGPLSQSCNLACISEGWSIQVNAILATIGHVQEAIDGIIGVPSSAYEHAGGNGHSKTNSLWYIATRPNPDIPAFQSEVEDLGTISTDEDDEIGTRDEDESEIISSDEEKNNGTSGDNEEEFEIISEDEEDSEIGGNEEDFETINIDEEDSNTTSEFEPEPEIIDSDDDLRFDFGEIGFDRLPEDLNVGNEDDSVSNDNNIFDNITIGNEIEGSYNNQDVNGDETDVVGLSCFNSSDCTEEVLNANADGYSCLDRIQYLMTVLSKSEYDACWQIAVDEYSLECGLCRPSL
jgi:endo-1,3(4)-beta-glucanase